MGQAFQGFTKDVHFKLQENMLILRTAAASTGQWRRDLRRALHQQSHCYNAKQAKQVDDTVCRNHHRTQCAIEPKTIEAFKKGISITNRRKKAHNPKNAACTRGHTVVVVPFVPSLQRCRWQLDD